jgi:hypothetical protein
MAWSGSTAKRMFIIRKVPNGTVGPSTANTKASKTQLRKATAPQRTRNNRVIADILLRGFGKRQFIGNRFRYFSAQDAGWIGSHRSSLLFFFNTQIFFSRYANDDGNFVLVVPLTCGAKIIKIVLLLVPDC